MYMHTKTLIYPCVTLQYKSISAVHIKTYFTFDKCIKINQLPMHPVPFNSKHDYKNNLIFLLELSKVIQLIP